MKQPCDSDQNDAIKLRIDTLRSTFNFRKASLGNSNPNNRYEIIVNHHHHPPPMTSQDSKHSNNHLSPIRNGNVKGRGY